MPFVNRQGHALRKTNLLQQNPPVLNCRCQLTQVNLCVSKGKGKGFPYSLPSIEPGADPSVQALIPQVTYKSSTRR